MTGVTALDFRTGAGGGIAFDCGGNYIFRDVDDSLATRITIESATGRMGIGTASPDELLDVNGKIVITSGVNTRYKFDIASDNAEMFMKDSSENINVYIRTSGDSYFSGGNVGIGVASPKTKLTVEGTLTLKEQAAADGDTAAYGQLWCKDNAGTTELWFTNDAGLDTKIV